MSEKGVKPLTGSRFGTGRRDAQGQQQRLVRLSSAIQWDPGSRNPPRQRRGRESRRCCSPLGASVTSQGRSVRRNCEAPGGFPRRGRCAAAVPCGCAGSLHALLALQASNTWKLATPRPLSFWENRSGEASVIEFWHILHILLLYPSACLLWPLFI